MDAGLRHPLQHEDAILDIAGARYAWIARMIRAAVVRPKVGQMGLTARLDRVLTHPLWGTLALLGVLAVVFWLTYRYRHTASKWLDGLIRAMARGFPRWVAGDAPWIVDLLADGLIGGVGMVITFLPILVIFFAVLGFLEDTGYMARAAYITDRFMHAMGLHGKSFMPLLLGFGCNVPSISGHTHHRDEARASAHDSAGSVDPLYGADGRDRRAGVGFLRRGSGVGRVGAGCGQSGVLAAHWHCCQPS